MDFFDNRYFKTSRILMIWVGLWPYDFSVTKSFRKIVMCFVTFYIVQSEITLLLTKKPDFDHSVDIVMPLFVCVFCFIKYCTSWVNSATIKDMLDEIKHDWNTLNVESEIKIIKKFAEIARTFILLYLSSLYGGTALFIGISFMPSVLNIILPLNESRPQRPILEGEYYVDKEKYFYPILITTIIAIFVMHSMAGATDCIFMVTILHACAMFNVVGQRLKCIFDDANSFESDNDFSRDNFSKRIVYCVQYHKRATNFVKKINNCYVFSCAIQFFLAIVLLTTLLLRLVNKLKPLKNINDAAVPAVHAGCLIVLIFLNIYPGQLLTDSSADLFHQAYCGQWYIAPAKVQKLLFILMQRLMKPSYLTAANLVTASLQIFATIVQTSVSYFTVLYTFKQ